MKQKSSVWYGSSFVTLYNWLLWSSCFGSLGYALVTVAIVEKWLL